MAVKPVRITKKKPLTGKQRRRLKGWQLKAMENVNKCKVREREQHRCRFVYCPCRQFNLFGEVSHLEHKGMGGDPTGERSLAEKMIYVCNWRHRESPWSVDKKRLRCVPLTPAGTDGLVAWQAKIDGEWVEIARETGLGRWELAEDAPAAGFVDRLTSELIERFRR